jgi:hypothetical protein
MVRVKVLLADSTVLETDLAIAGGYVGNLQVRSVLWDGGMEDVAQLIVPHPMLEMESGITDALNPILIIDRHHGLCKCEADLAEVWKSRLVQYSPAS